MNKKTKTADRLRSAVFIRKGPALLLLSAMILLMMTYTELRCFAYRRYVFLFLLVVVSIACLLEHHLMEYYYNVFPLMAFSGRRLFRDDPIPGTG